jgi:hypothetical protein
MPDRIGDFETGDALLGVIVCGSGKTTLLNLHCS